MDYGKISVLIVDDYMIIRKLVTQQLAMIGVTEVESAADGLEAEEILKDRKFDIILLDWGMPKKNGYTFLQECRANKKYNDVAIIMMTGESEKKSVKEALEAGAVSYLVKPVDLESLQDKIDAAIRWLEKRRISAHD
ncbi:MAG: response regulator [Rhodospirillales bacterium]|nr:response regulator [Alphaproteobacteria bacterium]MCB9977150.1 response regulator [Rhodospirillales bacterium]